MGNERAEHASGSRAELASLRWAIIDMQIVANAQAFATKMSDASAHTAYLSSLPGAVHHDGGVVVHHTSAAIHAAPVAFVSYDAMLDDGTVDRHFDENGREFYLPQEQTPAPPIAVGLRK